MRKLDQYLIRQFLTILVMALIGFITVFIIVDLFENLDRFIDNHVPASLVISYYGYTLPWFINIGLPMATLIATVFSVGTMVKRNEWTAMKSTGISLYRISATLIIIGVFLSYLSYEFEDKLVSWGNEKRFDIERKYMKKRSRRSLIRIKKTLTDVFLQKQEKTHISLAKYNVRNASARGIAVVDLNHGQLSRRVDAKTMVWVDSLSAWNITNYSLRTFDGAGTETHVILSEKDTLLTLNFTPEDITQQFKSPEELNYAELTERIALLKENGVRTTHWEIAQHFKISFAFTNMIVIIFGIPLVVLKQKGGLSFGAGMSVFVIFSYYAFIKFGQSLGYKEILDPLLSAWIGNIVFSIGGLLLLFSVRK
ncbi:MAG: LptF/LptG family permease [Candidatus Marinimicrobia bacterium]|nr:LptF/LptG family permease [Candidatus Neomarinimicrobiota bacterium]MBL7059424.1 LptF/LptG family permease [Candidatus Neomarinimicrobiota bacterium]